MKTPPFWIAAALLAPLVARAACPAAACVESIEVDNQRATQADGVTMQGNGDARERQVTLVPGAALAEGTVIETPARPRVWLQLVTANGNAVTLDPGTRLRIETVGATGERWTQLVGSARFAVSRALGFFEVSHERFLAAVKGTEFGVAVDAAQQEIRFDWIAGVVSVEQEVAVAIADHESGERDADDGGTQATLVQRELLSAQQPRLRYRLDPAQYIRRFRTYRDAEAFFREQAAADAQSGDPRRALLGQTQLASILDTVGKPREAAEILERAFAEAARQDRPRLQSRIAHQLGGVYESMRKFDQALPMLQRSLEIEQKLAGPGDSPGVAAAWIALGRAQGYAGDAGAWVASIERAVAIHQRINPGETTQRSAAIHKNLADALRAAGDRDRALREYETALAIKEQVWSGRAAWPLANGYQDLGLFNLTLGRTDQAIALLHKALATRSALFNGVHPSVAVALDDLGRAYQRAGDRDRALINHHKALDLRLQLYPEGHPVIVRSLRTLARLAHDSGDDAQARTYEAQANAMARRLGDGAGGR